ncbi:bis(5'-nucleosyl)-tetraphosphatase (symmetrical) YqeK [Alkalibacter rhizosphaerae]|uniref:bis(5'-nucleosyl)-tetraphosphatase (symmetrical) n=1 Tax=Alkalibacter rhizosphaerae TaxID=2815577 RepID=A0A974XE76_9FIRM|nr:bis(5'-nucleosyl)-tetraphosphatase (symmetrical) YqeK [Alkalibacter rhizosphaerae]QSX08203.1 bis(5'-nucleosyl)-tetraphosphatase (symmetrical) YqeK [Alkalibacter rhizosphaerae]
MDYDTLAAAVKKRISKKRFAHSLGVMEVAVQLAKRYGCDVEKTRIAAICHDCAKNESREQLLQKADQYGMILDDVVYYETQLMHGPVGSLIARHELGVEDEEILAAIAHHTTGIKEMSLLDKIIYLSDFVEPGRNYPGVEILRELAFVDLDRALIQAFDNTIRYVLSLDSVLHPNTIEARNQLIMRIGG